MKISVYLLSLFVCLPDSQHMKVGFHGYYEHHQHPIVGRIVLKLKHGAKFDAKRKIRRININSKMITN